MSWWNVPVTWGDMLCFAVGQVVFAFVGGLIRAWRADAANRKPYEQAQRHARERMARR